MLVMVGAIGVNIITFNLIIHKMKEPVYAEKLAIPTKKDLDARLIIGAALFGLGWGLSSLCPGPGMVNFFNMTHCIVWLGSLAIGQVGWDLIDAKLTASNGQKH